MSCVAFIKMVDRHLVSDMGGDCSVQVLFLKHKTTLYNFGNVINIKNVCFIHLFTVKLN